MPRVGEHLAQQAGEPVRQPGRGAAVVEVGGVLDDPVQTGRNLVRVALGEPELQVEPGHRGVDLDRFHRQPRQRQLTGGLALQAQHDLEPRVVREGPGRFQGLHHAVEGHVLVRVSGQIGLAHPGQQLAEARAAGQVHAQHEGVDEEADQLVQCQVGAPGHRHAHGDIGARAEFGQQRGECRVQHHERRRAAGAGQVEHGLVQTGVEGELDFRAAV